jgi:hypothetical protein
MVGSSQVTEAAFARQSDRLKPLRWVVVRVVPSKHEGSSEA